MPKFGMVIDLQKCVGCGACAIACKTENNTQDRNGGQTFNWADFFLKTEGKFPDVNFAAIPTLCNHCTNAPCVKACPVTPKAMHKHENGITMHNQDMCIGCRKCQKACPYSSEDVNESKVQYSVISYNENQPNAFYRDKKQAIENCSASGEEVSQKSGDIPPHRTLYSHSDYKNVRKSEVVEKCIFCEHRVLNNELPNCVVACPAKARVFGDVEDKQSEIYKLLKANKAVCLKNNNGETQAIGKGTKPNVFYIRSFKVVSK